MVAPGATLEALDGPWPEPDTPSHVVTRCHVLRKVPIGDLGVEDLRLLIAQKIGLPHILPPAVELLEADPHAEGDFFPSDLLKAVAATEIKDWAAIGSPKARFAAIARCVVDDADRPAGFTMAGTTVLDDLARHL